MKIEARMSLWDTTYNPKTERNSSREYIEEYLKNHYWLRAKNMDEAFKLLDRLASSPNIKNIYYYPIGLRPGKPIPVAEYVMELAVNSENEIGMLFWRHYYSRDSESIKDSETYRRIEDYWGYYA